MTINCYVHEFAFIGHLSRRAPPGGSRRRSSARAYTKMEQKTLTKSAVQAILFNNGKLSTPDTASRRPWPAAQERAGALRGVFCLVLLGRCKHRESSDMALISSKALQPGAVYAAPALASTIICPEQGGLFIWDIFISHAWEDKESLVRPLA